MWTGEILCSFQRFLEKIELSKSITIKILSPEIGFWRPYFEIISNFVICIFFFFWNMWNSSKIMIDWEANEDWHKCSIYLFLVINKILLYIFQIFWAYILFTQFRCYIKRVGGEKFCGYHQNCGPEGRILANAFNTKNIVSSMLGRQIYGYAFWAV